jgi:hypothetical protein
MSKFKDEGRTGNVVRVSRREMENIKKSGSDVKYYSEFGVHRVVENPRKVFYVSS